MPTPGILILSAPSGAGKTSLSRALVQNREDAGFTVSHTTRPQRPGEVDGQDYHFVDLDQFQQMVQEGQFVEHAKVFGNFYGTSMASIQALVDADRHAILEIDWQGARKIREQYPNARSVFIMPPSRQTLEKRLRHRKQDSDSVITQRMWEADSVMSHAHEYDVIIVNEHFDHALEKLNHEIDALNRYRPSVLDCDLPAPCDSALPRDCDF